MKILLIDPPFYRIIGFFNRYFPYGLVTVGTALQEAGHLVKVYDADWNERSDSIDYSLLPQRYAEYLRSFNDPDFRLWKEAEKIIRDFNPEVIGISVWTTYAASSFQMAKIAKAIFPDRPVIMGGPHASVKAFEVLTACKDTDYAIRGEGENALLELIEHVSRGSKDLSDIAGLSYRDGDIIRHNPERPLTKDLDIFPIIDRTILINEDRYSSEDMGLLMTRRGCPFSCTFCCTNTKRVSFRSTAKIIEEIREVKQRYRTTQFSIKDDSFTVNKSHVIKFCQELIGSKLNVNWQCNTRLNLIDLELLKLMKKAGCNFISVGVESGSERVLRSMNKGLTMDDIRRGIGLIKKAGIHCTGYFLIGVPGETKDDIAQTLDFMEELQTDFVSIGVYEPFPGTAMFQEGINRGLIEPDMSREQYFAVLPNDYYKKGPQRQVDTIEPEEFDIIQNNIKIKVSRYNTKLSRLVKMGMARLRTYLSNPAILFEDLKKLLSYR